MNEVRKIKLMKKSKELNAYAKLLKRYNNKRLRHFNGELKDGSYYKKVYEYWWDII